LGYRTVTEPGAGGEPSAVFRLITNLTIGVLFP
jgi:hypothetical protein